MSGRYAPLPNPLARDAEHEIDEAFGSDDEDNGESTPLNPLNTSTTTNTRSTHQRRQTLPGSYDFEADPFHYAVPPPGSPPGPSSYAVPNPYGNSNGIVPSSSAIKRPRVGFFRRTVGALLPSYYQRVSTEDEPHAGPARGGGTNNDGVFANITAKPGRGRVVQEGESIHVVPEEAQREVPPSYAVAQADQAPAYYETFVHTPSSGLDGEILVDGMSTGSIFTFAWSMLISLSFQFVGFLLTYLLHTTHAGKFGSRAGLGITVIQYAFFLRRRAAMVEGGEGSNFEDNLDWGESNPTSNDYSPDSASSMSTTAGIYHGYLSGATTEWLSFFLMSVGWFILLTSFLGFFRVKRWERGIRPASEPARVDASTDPDHPEYIDWRLFSVFGLSLRNGPAREQDENGLELTPALTNGRPQEELTEAEARLARDLRAAGLI
ncbi:hypothetical protein BU17DRAFT_52473 [Hysterangium stoloniferum]|nr:hypothetical protein BU17DRAFT_52473 [Hysterangium stoloniferum]